VKSHGESLVALCALIGWVELLKIGLVLMMVGLVIATDYVPKSEWSINKDALCCHTQK